MPFIPTENVDEARRFRFGALKFKPLRLQLVWATRLRPISFTSQTTERNTKISITHGPCYHLKLVTWDKRHRWSWDSRRSSQSNAESAGPSTYYRYYSKLGSSSIYIIIQELNIYFLKVTTIVCRNFVFFHATLFRSKRLKRNDDNLKTTPIKRFLTNSFPIKFVI